jgi:CheY-like chemotaxis protein
MAVNKIMLVEDDNNLRAIYSDRLTAEGYEVVSARDGEEALAMAVKEKPNLIISDVMMPKISGFDMLDILRTTPETKDVKVIMMTALSQAEDKARADKLGADKYLVKSQVTLEDVARVVHEVLADNEPAVATEAAPASTPIAAEQPVFASPAPTQPIAPTAFAAPAPVFDQPTSPAVDNQVPVTSTTDAATAGPINPITGRPIVTSAPTAPITPIAPAPTQPVVAQPMPQPPVQQPVLQTAPADPVAVMPTASPVSSDSGAKRVIQPLNIIDPNAQPKIYELYEKEMAAQASVSQIITPTVAPVVAPAPDSSTQTPPAPQFDPNSVAL